MREVILVSDMVAATHSATATDHAARTSEGPHRGAWILFSGSELRAEDAHHQVEPFLDAVAGERPFLDAAIEPGQDVKLGCGVWAWPSTGRSRQCVAEGWCR